MLSKYKEKNWSTEMDTSYLTEEREKSSSWMHQVCLRQQHPTGCAKYHRTMQVRSVKQDLIQSNS
jgi:hypothetical protein